MKQIAASWKKSTKQVHLKKGKIDRCQEKLAEGRKIILKHFLNYS